MAPKTYKGVEEAQKALALKRIAELGTNII